KVIEEETSGLRGRNAQSDIGEGLPIPLAPCDQWQTPGIPRPKLVAQGHADGMQQVRVSGGYGVPQFEQWADVLPIWVTSECISRRPLDVGVAVLQATKSELALCC